MKHIDIESKDFTPYDDLILIKPEELPTGELEVNGIVIEMEQNNSVVDRPTKGKVIKVGTKIDKKYIDRTLLWVEQDGIDVELKDGKYLLLQEKSILGWVD